MSSKPTPPSVGEHLIVDLSTPRVLHLILNRPKAYNAMTDALEEDIDRVLTWYEDEASLWALVISGNGKAFCAGQDLRDWATKKALPVQQGPSGHALQNEKDTEESIRRLKRGGFAAMSSRRSAKPVIAAVDGFAMGGGTELVLNCDLVIASTRSIFALPEVSRGVVASQGGIPRLAAIAGHHRAAEMLLIGDKVTATEAYQRFGFVNRVIEVSPKATPEEGGAAVIKAALEMAAKIAGNSPDAVTITKLALLAARDASSAEMGIDQTALEGYRTERSRALYVGENLKEGLQAFAEKRPTAWKNPPQFKAGGPLSKL